MVRSTIEQLRLAAVTCLLSPYADTQAQGKAYLRMVEIQKVRLLAMGVDVTVTSKEGNVFTKGNK